MRARVATVWLDGCSGCHMSILDMDERLLDLADKIELVYSPLVDAKEFPENVDVTLVEGSVNNMENWKKSAESANDQDFCLTRRLRRNRQCSVHAKYIHESVLQRAYVENTARNPEIPNKEVPPLLPQSAQSIL